MPPSPPFRPGLLLATALSLLCAASPPAAHAAEARRALRDSAAITVEMLRATRERPLFWTARRPPAPPIPVPAPMPPQAPAPASASQPLFAGKLVGIIRGGGIVIALIHPGMGGRVLALRPGGTIEGWRLAQVEPRQAIVTRDGRAVRLSLPERELALSGRAAAAAGAGTSRGDATEPGRTEAPTESRR